jgi:hypothetical protein
MEDSICHELKTHEQKLVYKVLLFMEGGFYAFVSGLTANFIEKAHKNQKILIILWFLQNFALFRLISNNLTREYNKALEGSCQSDLLIWLIEYHSHLLRLLMMLMDFLLKKILNSAHLQIQSLGLQQFLQFFMKNQFFYHFFHKFH